MGNFKRGFFVLSLAILGTYLFVCWHLAEETQRQQWEQKKHTLNQRLEVQNQFVQSLVENTYSRLQYFLSQEQSMREQNSQLKTFASPQSSVLLKSEYLALAPVEITKEGLWSISWMSLPAYWQTKEAQKELNKIIENLILKNSHGLNLYRILGPEEQPLLAVTFRASDQLELGFLPMTYFAYFANEAQEQKIILTDSDGFALAHPQPSYIGAPLNHLPLVKKMLHSKKIKGVLSLDDSQLHTIASFTRVSESNLSLLVTAEAETFSVWFWHSILTGTPHILAWWLLLSLLWYWLAPRKEAATSPPAYVEPEVQTVYKPDPKLLEETQLVRAGLTGVLGQVHLAMIKNHSTPVGGHLRSIENEINFLRKKLEASLTSKAVETADETTERPTDVLTSSIKEDLISVSEAEAELPQIKPVDVDQIKKEVMSEVEVEKKNTSESDFEIVDLPTIIIRKPKVKEAP